jgi:hypothetical protein
MAAFSPFAAIVSASVMISCTPAGNFKNSFRAAVIHEMLFVVLSFMKKMIVNILSFSNKTNQTSKIFRLDKFKALAVTLYRLYPHLDVYVRVRTLADQDELVAKGIRYAGTGYIESTLVRGGMLLKNLGVSEDDANELVKELQHNDFALIRAGYAEFEK